jgi:hypothetical protein
VRIELDDDLVLSMKRFDPENQRTLSPESALWVHPVRDTLLGPARFDLGLHLGPVHASPGRGRVTPALAAVAVGVIDDRENQISARRQQYNSLVAEYNTAILSFPANLVAGPFGFTSQPFFEIQDPAQREVPTVKF